MGGGYVRNSGRSTPSYSFSHLVPIRHWARDPALRSWPVLLLVALVCVPPIGLVLLNNATEAKIRDAAWIFEWTEPSVPKGWHGSQALGEGTVVVVRY